MTIKISPDDISFADRLFAHVHNDYTTDGTGKAGFNSAVTSKFMLDQINKLMLQRPEVYASLNAVQKLFEHISMLCNNADLQTLEQRTLYIADKLQAEGQIAFPAGYCAAGIDNKGKAAATGHLTVAEMRIDSDKLIFILHNAAVQQIFAFEGSVYKQQLQSSARVWSIPYSSLSRESLQRLVSEICAPLYNSNIDPEADAYTDEKYYSEINSALRKFAAVSLDPGMFNLAKIKGQRSGTCTWKALMVFLRNYLQNDLLYLTVKYDIKLQHLIEYREGLYSRITVPHILEHLTDAVDNLERLIAKLDQLQFDGIYTFDSERRALGVKIIKQVRFSVRVIKNDDSPKLKEYTTLQPAVLKPLTINVAEVIASIKDQQPKNMSGEFEIPVFITFDASAAIQSLENLKTVVLNEKVKALHRLLVLERFVLGCDLPTSLSSAQGLNSTEKQQIINLWADLASIHFHLCAKQGIYTLRFESLAVAAALHLHLCVIFHSTFTARISDTSPLWYKFAVPLYGEFNKIQNMPKIIIDAKVKLFFDSIYYTRNELKPFLLATEADSLQIYNPNLNWFELVGLFNQEPQAEQDLALDLCLAVIHSLTTLGMLYNANVENLPEFDAIYNRRDHIKVYSNRIRNLLPAKLILAKKTTTTKNPSGSPYAKTYLQSNFDCNYYPAKNYQIFPGSIFLDQAINDSIMKNFCTYNFSSIEISTDYTHVEIDESSVFDQTLEELCLSEGRELREEYKSYPLDKMIKFIISLKKNEQHVKLLDEFIDMIDLFPESIQYAWMQDLISANLFNQTLLAEELSVNSQSLCLFITVLHTEFKKYIDSDKLNIGALFVLRLTANLNDYLLDLLPKISNDTTKLISTYLQNNINVHLPALIAKHPQNIELRCIQLAQAKHKFKESIVQEDIAELLTIHILLHNFNNIVNNKCKNTWLDRVGSTEIILQQQNAIREYLCSPQNSTSAISRIAALIDPLNFSASVRVEGIFPTYHCISETGVSLTINVLTAKLRNNPDLVRETLPEFLNNALYQNLSCRKLLPGRFSVDGTFTFKEDCDEYMLNIEAGCEKLKIKNPWPVEDTVYEYINAETFVTHPLQGKIPTKYLINSKALWVSESTIMLSSWLGGLPNLKISADEIVESQSTVIDTANLDQNSILHKLCLFGTQEVLATRQPLRPQAEEFLGYKSEFRFLYTSARRSPQQFVLEYETNTVLYIESRKNKYIIPTIQVTELISGFSDCLTIDGPIDSPERCKYLLLIDKVLNYDFMQDDISYTSVRISENLQGLVKHSLKIFAGNLDPEVIAPILFRYNNNFSTALSECNNLQYTKIKLTADGLGFDFSNDIERTHIAFLWALHGQYLKALQLLKQCDISKVIINKYWLENIIDGLPEGSCINSMDRSMLYANRRLNPQIAAIRMYAVYLLSLDPELEKHSAHIQNHVRCIKEYINLEPNMQLELRLTAEQKEHVLQIFKDRWLVDVVQTQTVVARNQLSGPS